MRQPVRTAGNDAGAFHHAIDGGLDGFERGAVKRDEVFLAEEEIELGGGELVRAREIDGVGDDEEIRFVVLDLRQGTRRDTVLDGERVKLENALENGFGFLVGGVVEIHPQDQALVGADEAQRLEFEVPADEFALTEDERVNHYAPKLAGMRRLPSSAADLRRTQQLVLGRDERLGEILGSGGGKERFAIVGVFQHAAQRTENLKIVAGSGFGGTQHKHQAYRLTPFEGNASFASPHRENDALHVIRAGVWDGESVTQTGCIEPVAREKLGIEAIEILHRRM